MYFKEMMLAFVPRGSGLGRVVAGERGSNIPSMDELLETKWTGRAG